MSIDFSLSDEEAMLHDTVASFAREKIRPNLRAFESARAVAADVATGYRDLGIETLEIPQALGGAGLGVHARVLINREFACADAGAALALDRLGPALYVLAAFGGEAALRRFALPLLETPAQRAVLVLEDDTQLAAYGGRVRGAIPWVPAERADLIVGLGVDRAWILRQGISVTPLRGAGLRAAGASELRLDGDIEAEWSGRNAACEALAKVRLYVASLLAGVLYDATEFSRAYAMERVAFGRPVAHHQAMAFLLVDMHAAIERAWLLIEDAASRIDAGEKAYDRAAAAFVDIVEASRFIGPNAVQILGGHGFMADFPMEKAMRESRALGLLAGGVDRARQDALAQSQTNAEVSLWN